MIMSRNIILNTRPISKNRGFTILEAIIGFLILSIGMLGIASLQAVAMQAGKTSVYSSVAMMKVEELFESMRANPGAIESYAGSGAGVSNGCSGASCTPEALASDDLFWWSRNLRAGLPEDATVLVAVTPPPLSTKMATATITVNWDERDRDAGGSIARTFTVTSNICTENPC